MKGCCKGFLIGLAGLLIAMPGFASPSLCNAIAGNLVPNCGFETGDFTGWTVAPFPQPGDFITFVDTGLSGLAPNSGTYFAALGTFNGDGSLGPTVSLVTVPGQTYTFSFYLTNLEPGSLDNPNDFSADWAGTTLLSLSNAPNMPYTHYSFTETATSTATTIGFTERNDVSYWGLDDVSVVPVDPGGVPEPSTMFLMATGLIGVGLGRWAFRRRLAIPAGMRN
jgi:hypothetical protein